MIKEKSRAVDPVRKLEIVTFADKYGAEMILQHPLTLVGYNPKAEEEAVIALMEQNVSTFEAMVNREK